MKVLILHGLYMHSVVMQPLSHKLRKQGFETQTITYNTVSINEQVVFAKIDAALSDNKTNILVGHSLGGLIIKQYLTSRRPLSSQISHVITIGSPIQGASIVERITQLGFSSILGNSPQFGLNLHNDRWDFPQKLGCIAGTLAVGVRPILMMDNSTMSDGTVTVEETMIDGMTDHIQTPSSHTSLIYSAFVPEQIQHFVHYDEFRR
ncbi:cob(I)alamin adenolsyltransferase/cobinamide ATP-dependent adenolsyltransferase [Vibrio renipiscarius]|uniref:Cobinamide adenolsyltransferase n=1 Tax=Vibrio renipiscarius TaxID=1461322 RepID=A0A0C2NAX9_9VIBR|nr:cob(I)alamin adenolsyltransferase/cobinamide ATP-dependent adenolsyltransferase [Vibrio renipiscarius]KII76786.1 cobinamide adenolsyltransferase [Vibrio renipiscarius]KII78332.1 cobinamide adenolsyltransferase [Vibrio renipiscarius]